MVKSPKSDALPVVIISTKSMIFVNPPVSPVGALAKYPPPATPRVRDAPPHPNHPRSESPKSIAFPFVAIVTN